MVCYKWGTEGEVDWYWTNGLTISINIDAVKVTDLPPHPVHSYSDIAQLGGNKFHGSYTFVAKNGSYWHCTGDNTYNPTSSQHTEPQYFEDLIGALDKIDNLDKVKVLILEMRQTNTPCSGAKCRPYILECIQHGKVGPHSFDLVLARMSAYARYPSQYPKVSLTSFERDDIANGKAGEEIKNGELIITRPAAIHRVPATI